MAFTLRVVLATCMLFISLFVDVHSNDFKENNIQDTVEQKEFRQKRDNLGVAEAQQQALEQQQQFGGVRVRALLQQQQPVGGGQYPQQYAQQGLRYQQQQQPGLPKLQKARGGIQNLAGQQQLNGQVGIPGAKKLTKKLATIGSKQFRISQHPACLEDVQLLCGKDYKGSNFAVLDCLQNDRADNSQISDPCNNFLWQYKLNLTMDVKFESAAAEVCKVALTKLTDCSSLPKGRGEVLPCLYEHLENVTAPQCLQYLKRMMAITFSDYRLIKGFYDTCRDDIETTSCGDVLSPTVDKKGRRLPHSQGAVVNCLEENTGKLHEPCKKQVLRVAELAANDYHLDRSLYFACREDRDRFCDDVTAGQGKIYKCLMKHKFEREMKEECRIELTKKQKLTVEDYKVNVNIQRKCKPEIKKFQCDARKPKDQNIKLSVILLCLELNIKQGKKVSGDCQGEIFDMRKQLMEDYMINPRIILACRENIGTDCEGLQREGKTLHCLMKLAKDDKLHNGRCRAALKELVKETEAGEDVRTDTALERDCRPVEDALCKGVSKGNARVLTCLMDNINAPEMTKACETRLLTLQYFITRDFKLDPQLYKACKKNAIEFCYMDEDDDPNNKDNDVDDDDDNTKDGMIFNCLHERLHPGEVEGATLSDECRLQMHRALRQRAVSVHLNPNIERECRRDLGAFCSEKNEKGEEMACLQDNMDKLEDKCKKLVGRFTGEESEDIKMNKILMKACSPMLSKFCKDHLKQQLNEGILMQCLIEHKNDNEMDEKCAAGVEHFQLLELKDYRFSFKFKEACRADVTTYCKGGKEKSAVISCLSQLVRDDTLVERTHRVSDDCRKQLKFEELQKAENIKLDPELNKACAEDIHTHCSGVKEGNARIIECLRAHQSKLGNQCHMKIFNKQKKEAINPEFDHTFMHVCKRMIKQFCQGSSPQEIFKCLKQRKNDPAMDSKCKEVLTKRQISKMHDYRLNPMLQKACSKDIIKFCKEITDTEDKQVELEGKVIECLKAKHTEKKLSRSCDDRITSIMKDAAMDFRMDPLLARVCRNTAKTLCIEEFDDPGSGRIEECLKVKLQHNKISDKDCKMQVIRLLAEAHADVQVDPLLHKACALDIKHYCVDIPQGEGRHMSCLLEALEDKTVRLRQECRRMLMERKEMWEYAAENAPPETVQELVMSIHSSPSRNYFFSVFIIFFGCLFMFGMFCGRVTKHVRAEVKNK
ncbi:Golgi apparatus protein 1-like [Anneissia japonica]|uniref:Golgi apparatus protein 1-like n=1 Tax=Anneissia japonica TaxID=1529436 RepID=UPI001425564B|nr:Golgi apparatus protein 1-like [Anneissia japonica]